MVSRNSVDYDNFGETFGKSRRSLRWEDLNTLLSKIPKFFRGIQGGRIADIGCGNGRLLKHILEHSQRQDIQEIFQEYVGLDLSQVLLAQAKKDREIAHVFHREQFLLGDMRELQKSLESFGTFDVIFFIASFHHLENPDERVTVLKQSKKLLIKNGKIAILNWDLFHPEHAKYASSKEREYPDGSADFMIKIGKFQRFYHAFSPEEFQTLANKAGLTILEQDFSSKNSLVILSR